MCCYLKAIYFLCIFHLAVALKKPANIPELHYSYYGVPLTSYDEYSSDEYYHLNYKVDKGKKLKAQPNFEDQLYNEEELRFPEQTNDPHFPEQTNDPHFPEQINDPHFEKETNYPHFPEQTNDPQFPEQINDPHFEKETNYPHFPEQTNDPQFPEQINDPHFEKETNYPHFPEDANDIHIRDYPDQQVTGEQEIEDDENDNSPGSSCWMSLSTSNFFKAMDDMEKKYARVRAEYYVKVGHQMDQQMFVDLLHSRGAAHRAVYKAGGDSLQIPAGINLGGLCMVRLKDSILFFHRMKLRNSTHFEVTNLHHNLEKMVLLVDLNLNDLHLTGAYERSPTHEDGPSTLFYRPSFGNIELLLKSVAYHMEGRLRMMADRLTLELINSELIIKDDILLKYLNTNITNKPEYTVSMEARNMDDYFQRLKTDLDLWLKDYFNDYLMYYQLPNVDNTKFQEGETKKTIYLNEFANYAINAIRQRIYDLGGNEIFLPTFTLFGVPSTILRITQGTLRGLQSMHIRSVATGEKITNNLRKVDCIVGFSRLRAEYKFEAVLPNGAPPLSGYLILTGDEMTTHLSLSLLKNPNTIDLNFDFLQQLRPEFLTIEGPANRLIANYKHVLENQILAIISNTLVHNIKMLRTITRCSPFIYGNMQVYRLENNTAQKF